MKKIMKPLCLVMTLSALLLTNISNAQKWDGSTINTWTMDDVGIGTTTTDASLDIRTPFKGTTPNATSFRIWNDQCVNCAYASIPGYIPNVVEVHRRISHYNPGSDDYTYDPIDVAHPFFVISESGKVGINNQPDELLPFKLNVEGRSHFSDKVLIGEKNIDIDDPLVSGFKLYVEEGILTEKVQVSRHGGARWPDYVFEDSYQLATLNEVEEYLKENKHLPNIPSASEVEKNGIDLGDMDAALLRKVEELTLYMIDLKKENEALRNRVEQLEK